MQHGKDKPALVRPYILQDQLKELAEEHKSPNALQSPFAEVLLQGCQEVAINPPDIAFAMRPSIGVWEYVQICVENLAVRPLGIPEYLQFKERLVGEAFKLLHDALADLMLLSCTCIHLLHHPVPCVASFMGSGLLYRAVCQRCNLTRNVVACCGLISLSS